MSNIPSANQKIQIEATDYRSPVSESLLQTMGGSINYSLDQVASNSSSISTVSGNLTSLTTQLNSSATCFKQEGVLVYPIQAIGNNNTHNPGDLIQTITIPLTATTTGYYLVYFAANRIDTTRSASSFQIDLTNEPDFGNQRLVDSSPTVGFNETFFLIPTASILTFINVKLYAGGLGLSTQNRWNFKVTAVRFNPADFIIP